MLNKKLDKKMVGLLVILISITSFTYAHGTLESLPKAKIIELQKIMLQKKYLKSSQIKWGVVNTSMEDAYDQYEIDQMRERIKKDQAELEKQKMEASTTEIVNEIVDDGEDTNGNIFRVVWKFVKNWF